MIGIAGHEAASVGDHVVTRHNDRTLRTEQGQPVRNRDRWTVQAIGRDGSLTLTHQHGDGAVTLPADYARQHVRLGYAATAHGNQGDTVDIGLAVVTPATSHRSLYVGATRGRHENRLLVVADDLDDSRDVLEQVLTNDRADVPAVVRRRELLEQVEDRPSDAGRTAGQEPPRRHRQPSTDERVTACAKAYEAALRAGRPHFDRLDRAQDSLDDAEREVQRLRFEARTGGRIHRVRLREPLRHAEAEVDRLTPPRDEAAEQAEPFIEAADRASTALDAARRAASIERFDRQVEAKQRRGPQRPSPGFGIA